jgi:hypothetical protein
MLTPAYRDALVNVGWIWPAYIRNGYVFALAKRLIDADVAKQQQILEQALSDLYRPEHLAAMLLGRYRKVPLVSDFDASISESLEAAHLGLFHAAVSTLIPVIEGIIRRAASKWGEDVGKGTKRLAREVRKLATHERSKADSAADERAEMLEIFADFLDKKLLMQTSSFTGWRDLNRHGVVHGIFVNFGCQANFYILVSILDLLTFSLAFRTSGVSMLAPDSTSETEALARYYKKLQLLGGARRR